MVSFGLIEVLLPEKYKEVLLTLSISSCLIIAATYTGTDGSILYWYRMRVNIKCCVSRRE